MLKKMAFSLLVLNTLTLSLAHAEDFQVLKEITDKPTQLKEGQYKGN